MIKICGMVKDKNYVELSKKKGSRSCAIISQVLGNINEAVDYRWSLSDNVQN